VPIGDGGASESGGQRSALAGAAGDGSGGERLGMGGAPPSIEMSIWPTFAGDPNQSRDVQAVFAAISSLTLGATTLTLAERWDELAGPTGSPRAVAWTRIDAMVAPYRDRGGHVAFCIDVVDREQKAWPFSQELDTEVARAAMHRTIDEVYGRYAAQLSHLCFGYQLDRYWAVASKAERARLSDFLKDSVDYATQQRPARLDQQAIGVAVTLDALAGDAQALKPLLLGDEVLGVYDPLDSTVALKAPDTGAREVGAALNALAGSTQTLALLEVGYPSGAGSSEKSQRAYYDALFGVLDAQPASIGFLGIFGLADRSPSDCAAEATSFGDPEAAAEERAEVRCSMGLRADGRSKLALDSVLGALARYR
jgi:hypothetical protein